MEDKLQKRMYEMEVNPPSMVWDKLSADLDEINADRIISLRLTKNESLPPEVAWENITKELYTENPVFEIKTKRLKLLRPIAVAAIFVGVIITVWLLVRNNSSSSDDIVTTAPAVKNNIVTNSDSENEKETILNTDSPINTQIASVSFTEKKKKSSIGNKSGTNSIPLHASASPSDQDVFKNNEPLRKSFDKPIDDLSLVTSDENYLTMVNANGRLAKIPSHLAHLAPHMQDKPVEEDFFEIMFGEGTYWKETMSQWQKKIATAPISTGDVFTSLVELLKSVQGR